MAICNNKALLETNGEKNAMFKKLFLIFCTWSVFTRISTLAYIFPKDFLFGASTAAYQVEGAWNLSGKGESIWDYYTHTHPNAIKDKSNGDIAANSYYQYKEDSTFVKNIGFQVYRLSLSWPRLLPNGDLSKINYAAIEHYNNVINDICRKNIQPMLTIYHWDLPQKLQEKGGWINPSIVDHMVNYADFLFHHFGDRVKWWSTVNEPLNIIRGYYFKKTLAPSLGLGDPSDYTIVHHVLLSHGRIYRLYDKKYRKWQKGKVSITLDYETGFAKTNSTLDIQATERYFEFMLGIFANPIYSTEGDYPKIVRDIVRENSLKAGLKKSRLPEFTAEEKSYLKGAFDYFSLNHYTSYLCSHPAPGSPAANVSTQAIFYEDLNVHLAQGIFWPKTPEPDMKVNPTAFRVALNTVKERYNNPEVFVTENGYSDPSTTFDYKRVVFHQLYLDQLLKAVYLDGCNVIGYTIWSLLDNFQWLNGYTSRFGIIYVDFNSSPSDRTRSRKLSSYWMEATIKLQKLPNLTKWLSISDTQENNLLSSLANVFPFSTKYKNSLGFELPQ